MTPTAIFSLDCEGRWGGADKLGAPHYAILNDETLKEAYSKICGIFEEFEVPATFAFVGCFALSSAEFERNADRFRDLARMAPWYLDPVTQRASSTGWHGEWALDMAAGSRAGHEIGLHGVTHVPWGRVGKEFADAEMAFLKAASAPLADQVKTFIHPRNDVAHVEVLATRGFKGYRDRKSYSLPGGHMLDELNAFAKADRHSASLLSPTVIPAGYFVNWLHGARRAIPQQFTLVRSRNILRNAAARNGVAHFWTHPENMVSAPATLGLLRGMVRQAAALRDKGKLTIMTQASYCDEVSRARS